MMSFKRFHYSVKYIIIILTICTKSESSFLCGHHKNYNSPVSTPKCNYVPETIITSRPETKIEIVKFLPKNENIPKVFYVLKKAPNSKDTVNVETKRKTLLSILQAFHGTSPICHNSQHTTAIYPFSSTIDTNTSNLDPKQTTNFNTNNQVIHGHSYVYNINNHGTHYHSYDPKSTKSSNSPDVKQPNENHAANGWVNDVKLV